MTPVSTRDKILKAATVLFAKRGFLATNTKEIARRARCNEATIFRVFGNKEALFEIVMREQTEIGLRQMPVSDLDIPDFPAAMHHWAARSLQVASPEFVRLVTRFRLDGKKANIERFLRDTSSGFVAVVQRIEVERQAGRLVDGVQSLLAARALFALIWNFVLEVGMRNTARGVLYQEQGDDLRQMIDIWLRGILKSD